MPKTMDTSQWIAFFRKAGLPSNVAANYALIFSDNRIQVDMLLDLSKEYLYDMGIKVMGDVIAILKFAKEFHNQLAKERVIGNPTSISKTPVGRMVGHYTRPSPVRGPSNTADRGLGVGLPRKPNVISLKRKNEDVGNAKKVRRVPPEEEGAYKIKMPSGTTERTRKILQLQLAAQGSKRSVFTRLGDSAVSSSTDSKVTSSVFERLGPSSKHIGDDMPSSTVPNEKPQIRGPPLPYKGVLKMTFNAKNSVASSRKVNLGSRTVLNRGPAANKNIIKTVKLNQINTILQGANPQRRALVKTTKKAPGSQGLFGQKASSNIKSRLGVKTDARNLVRTKMLATKKYPIKGSSNVFDRLGR